MTTINLVITDKQLEVLAQAFDDADAWREPQNSGCCPDNELCEDHANDQRMTEEYADLLAELQTQGKAQL